MPKISSANLVVKELTPRRRLFFNLSLPIVIVSLLLFGWITFIQQTQVLQDTTIQTFQKAELEIVRGAARSIDLFVHDQIRNHEQRDITQLEQEIFKNYIEPIKLLQNGDAWIYAPDHVVFDLSADFPDEYRGKGMAQIFGIQKELGASHYEEMAEAVTTAQEGVGWYIWLPEKGREIAAWTPVRFGPFVWTIGLSVPLPELLAFSGVSQQIDNNRHYLAVATIFGFFILIVWAYLAWSRNQADKALEASREMLRTVLDTIPQAICWKDVDFAYLGCNENFNKMAKVKCFDDLVGSRETDSSWQSKESDRFAEIDQRVIETNQPVLHDVFSTCGPDGKQIWLDTSRVPLHNRQGDVNGIMVMYEDVTTARTGEMELAQLREFLANVVNSMPSILVGVDTQSRIHQWNSAAENETGISVDEAIGQLFVDVFPQITSKIKWEEQYTTLNKPMKIERVEREKDGQIRYWDVTVYPLIPKELIGFVILLDDVTDRIRVNEIMIQTEKMASVGGLAAGMAHEINNPLAGVLQNAQVLQKRISAEMGANITAAEEVGTTMETIHQYMEKRSIPRITDSILEAARRASKIVNNMLSFSRKSELNFGDYDLREVVDATIDLVSNDFNLKNQTDFKRIKIEKVYEESMPTVVCERTKIQQVVLNLLRNAAQAITEEENDSPQIILRVYSKGKTAFMELEDNGPGMSEFDRKRVFEPFFTTKKVGAGVGLGLSVSYFIITENHGGKISVEALPEKGTRFIMELPIAGRRD